jgi:hypothetical protein
VGTDTGPTPPGPIHLQAPDGAAAETTACPPQPAPPDVKSPTVPAAFAARYAGGTHTRTYADVQPTFDANRSRFGAAYNRWRRDTTCHVFGAMVFALAIRPDGAIEHVELLASNFGNPPLEIQLVELIKGLRFPAKEGTGIATIAYLIALTEY